MHGQRHARSMVAAAVVVGTSRDTRDFVKSIAAMMTRACDDDDAVPRTPQKFFRRDGCVTFSLHFQTSAQQKKMI